MTMEFLSVNTISTLHKMYIRIESVIKRMSELALR